MNLPASQILKKIGSFSDHKINLGETALVLGKMSRPNIKLDVYRRHLQSLEQEIKLHFTGRNKPVSVNEQQEALAQILYKRYGYIGALETNDEDEGANLTFVIDRREGSATALGVLYIQVASAQGWEAVGLDFPERFIIRLQQNGARLIIDPFSGGQSLTPTSLRNMLKSLLGNQEELKPDNFRELSNREVLVRLQEEVMIYYLSQNRINEMLKTIHMTHLFAPNVFTYLQKSGKIKRYVENFTSTLLALEKYVKKNIRSDNHPLAKELVKNLRIHFS